MVPFVTIARIVKTRGIKGEVAAELLTDFPERFESVTEVRILRQDREYREEIEAFWFHQGRVILKFRGRNSPEEVSELVWGDVQVPESLRPELPPDTYYHSDLIGCRIVEGGEDLGQVVDILESGPEMTTLVVHTPRQEEFMVPLVREFVTRVDTGEKVIEVKLPPGLLEL
ncbi:MAG: ribosome maturation factor RimM [Acidobacteriota bacterium]